ncbi:DUF3306 domain-containing protein [Craurococcus roseus]|uniref:DUF3306 domain-containing protein n=1 Tax=Craurococcus roseus TaxID=77585 RepID=A0ABN1G0S8_9PROT
MSEEGFLSRWSRRKRAAVAPPPAAPAPPQTAQAGTPPPPTGAERAEPAFDPASLPPLESLTADSDFVAFLRDEVPAALRNAALRRAWSLDPAIRDFVGPADFAWDFNAPGGGMPGFSLELPRDVERLLAQAIGLDTSSPEEEEQGPEAPPLAPATEGAASPLPEPAPAEDAAPGAPLRLEADAPLPGPVAEVPPASPAQVAENPPPKRRHGGALPT